VTVRDDTERGLELGIPLDGLVGMDEYFAVFLADLAFLLTLAIASPFAGRLHLSFGQRGLFIIGMLASASSYLGLVFATDLVQIMALRALTGVGYAFATIACFEYLLDRRSDDSRERTIGVFVAVIMGGTFAGTAIGGILADRLGYRPVFAISFFIVIVSGALALRMMKRGSAGEHDGSAAFKLANLVGVLKRPRLVALLAGITIPMNVLMAAFLWYLVPLTLAAAGSGAAAIARTLMVYYLVILVGGPLFSRLGNTRMRPWVLVGIGSLLSGAVLLVPAMNPTALTISLAVLVVGLGHPRAPATDVRRAIKGTNADPMSPQAWS
jgi:MFS family permease